MVQLPMPLPWYEMQCGVGRVFYNGLQLSDFDACVVFADDEMDGNGAFMYCFLSRLPVCHGL